MRRGEYQRHGWVEEDVIPSATATGPADPADIVAPPEALCGLLVFVYGPGSCRPGPRDLPTAEYLAQAGYATAVADLAPDTPRTGSAEPVDAAAVADLSRRLTAIIDAAAGTGQPVGLFAAGAAAAAALVTAAERPEVVRAVVSRGGSPDLAGATLADVVAPTLLILGGQDGPLIAGNKRALAVLGTDSRLVVLPTVRHLFAEPEALRDVARYARNWFDLHLKPASAIGGTGAGDTPDSG